mmetsp:Transcript_27333/g.61789  ORF Transcript_27333/g.61789 Transcript_27333/m.61789 type:complete len:217 (+) Transcript_27333:727-1377(+)
MDALIPRQLPEQVVRCKLSPALVCEDPAEVEHGAPESARLCVEDKNVPGTQLRMSRVVCGLAGCARALRPLTHRLADSLGWLCLGLRAWFDCLAQLLGAPPPPLLLLLLLLAQRLLLQFCHTRHLHLVLLPLPVSGQRLACEQVLLGLACVVLTCPVDPLADVHIGALLLLMADDLLDLVPYRWVVDLVARTRLLQLHLLLELLTQLAVAGHINVA